MQLVLSVLLLASLAAAAPSGQPESEVPSVVHSSQQPQQQSPPQQPSPVVESSVQSAPVEGQQVPVVHSPAQQQQVAPPQQQSASHYAPAGVITVVQGSGQAAVAQQAPPTGVTVGEPAKPVQPVRSYSEQYGQPESAGLPPNYKPFGSWGLYIGGNPADGYYTNYYKALGSSVDKQVGGVEPQQVGAVNQAGVSPVKPVASSAYGPILRQASSSPYVGGDYYPFVYSQGDLNTGARVAIEQYAAAQQVQPQQPPVAPLSPAQAGAQVYGAPSVAAYDQSVAYPAPHYSAVDAYASRKGGAYVQKEVAVKEPQYPQPQQAPAKGYQSRVYVYPSPSVGQLSAPSPFASAPAPVAPVASAVQQSGSQQQGVQSSQVVAYPVPVGSQIVGSQPGIDGAFSPYGVHAFTRYAVKPTLVSQDHASYYYSVPAFAAATPPQTPAYKQPLSHSVHHSAHQHSALAYQPLQQQSPAYQVQSANGQIVPSVVGSQYPLGFYGYPLSQLHYSQGSVVGVHDAQPVHHGQVHGASSAPAGPESVSEKFESEEKPGVVVHKQQ